MSIERVRSYFSQFNIETRILEFEESSATVELAAKAAGTEPARIAKTMSFWVDDAVILILLAGDAKIDNSKYKAQFHTKAKMLSFDEVEPNIGHGVGGVCLFGINEGIKVYLDISMKRFETVFPAAGSSNSAIELTIDELESYSNAKEWIDVSKPIE